MDNLFSFLMIILVAVICFIVCRKFFCWYTRINERIDLMNEQIRILKEISRKLDGLRG